MQHINVEIMREKETQLKDDLKRNNTYEEFIFFKFPYLQKEYEILRE